MLSMTEIRFKDLFHVVMASACLCVISLTNVNAADGSPATKMQVSTLALYAIVGDREITVDEYNQSYNRTVRQRYYHSKPPEGELEFDF